MAEINASFHNTDVVLLISANYIVNISASDHNSSQIAGMLGLKVWNAKNSIMLKRSMPTGYARAQN